MNNAIIAVNKNLKTNSCITKMLTILNEMLLGSSMKNFPLQPYIVTPQKALYIKQKY